MSRALPGAVGFGGRENAVNDDGRLAKPTGTRPFAFRWTTAGKQGLEDYLTYLFVIDVIVVRRPRSPKRVSRPPTIIKPIEPKYTVGMV